MNKFFALGVAALVFGRSASRYSLGQPRLRKQNPSLERKPPRFEKLPDFVYLPPPGHTRTSAELR